MTTKDAGCVLQEPKSKSLVKQTNKVESKTREQDKKIRKQTNKKTLKEKKMNGCGLQESPRNKYKKYKAIKNGRDIKVFLASTKVLVLC